MIYHILDIFFVFFHTGLILFNLFGWIWKKTRVYNLVTILATGASWLFLGLLVGTIGYCPLTDWHFNILGKLGKTGLPSSYIKYLADRLPGMEFNSYMIDNLTLYFYILALGFSIFLNIRDFKRKIAGSSRN
jgi:hypothetical protein